MPLSLVPGRLRHNLDAALEDVLGLDQFGAPAAAEQRLEGILEVLPICSNVTWNWLERGLVDFIDRRDERGLRGGEIVDLVREKIVPLLQLGVFLDCDEIHRPHPVEPLAQAPRPRR